MVFLLDLVIFLVITIIRAEDVLVVMVEDNHGITTKYNVSFVENKVIWLYSAIIGLTGLSLVLLNSIILFKVI